MNSFYFAWMRAHPFTNRFFFTRKIEKYFGTRELHKISMLKTIKYEQFTVDIDHPIADTWSHMCVISIMMCRNNSTQQAVFGVPSTGNIVFFVVLFCLQILMYVVNNINLLGHYITPV